MLPKAVAKAKRGKTSAPPKAKTPTPSVTSLAKVKTRAGSKTQADSEQDEANLLQCSSCEEIYALGSVGSSDARVW